MELEQTIVDKNFQEIKQHGPEQFPIAVYEDDFSQFEYGLILWHWHEQIQFTLAVKGQVNMLIGECEVLLKEGEAIFINRAVLHQMQPVVKNFGTVYSFILKSQLLESDITSNVYTNCMFPILNGLHYIVLSREEIDILLEVKNIIEMKNKGYEILVKSKMCSLWYNIITRKPENKVATRFQLRDIERVKQAMQYIHMNYDKKITLDDIAKSANVSKSELCRCFQRITHKTPFEYLIRYRVLQACNMLHNQECTITEAALHSGFDSISHMGRFFHKYLNQTPSQYRKSLM